MSGGPVRTKVHVCIDCADAARLAPFWATAMDYTERHEPGGWHELVDPTGVGPVVWFQPVPEAKTTKNRLHLDVWFPDEAAVEARRDTLVALGGVAVARFHDFWLMTDPEGNEFCLCWPL